MVGMMNTPQTEECTLEPPVSVRYPTETERIFSQADFDGVMAICEALRERVQELSED